MHNNDIVELTSLGKRAVVGQAPLPKDATEISYDVVFYLGDCHQLRASVEELGMNLKILMPHLVPVLELLKKNGYVTITHETGRYSGKEEDFWCKVRGRYHVRVANRASVKLPERAPYRAVKRAVNKIREAHAEGAAMDAGFDAGEFSGPVHARREGREIDELLRKYGWSTEEFHDREEAEEFREKEQRTLRNLRRGNDGNAA